MVLDTISINTKEHSIIAGALNDSLNIALKRIAELKQLDLLIGIKDTPQGRELERLDEYKQDICKLSKRMSI